MHRVVIVGGGFGGLQAAVHLKGAPVEVTLIDRRNFHLFQPLAYQVATGALSPGEVAYPLRTIFRDVENVRVLMGEVTAFDVEAREVVARTYDGEERFGYDTLIVAGGSKYNYFGHPEWQEHAAELKSLEGALHIRAQILRAFEAAEVASDPAERDALQTFVIVGAGPTGVEMAGQIAEIAHDTRRDFLTIDTRRTRVLLVEAGDRVLSSFPDSLSERARKSLVKLGVTPMLGHLVTDIDAGGVTMKAGPGHQERVASGTIIWAAGVLASSVAGHLARAAGGEVDGVGRVLVGPDLALPGHPELLAIGDMVRVQGADPFPGVAPVAMQMGRFAARVVRARAAGGSTGPFVYHDKGNIATIGRARAVAQIRAVKVSGFPAWLLWLVIHLWYLIGFQNRLLVLIRWTFSFITHGRGTRLITGEDNQP